MNTQYEFGNSLPRNIVYVKPVAVADLPEEVRSQVAGAETLYAVHREDGEQLALVADRKMAFALARQNDMAPVAVH
ncbi:DUF1150 family protein [Marinovum sp. 2_MG-2023]|uniref:DUF1150 family protein n=1 Tax=Roseobacteraceae TaxID=2854170 RepID=UPI001FD2E113|nr:MULTISPECIES: DUF1150 family protein [Roseobacteraceae]MCJ7872968.1 DUF1150 domain-containing protein [Phaeobacter sp. J2-8]MDO6731732.1 DUF1150 family protein [Marinovum sp. 2_MG-2023]MDO6780984.1 DUF1150 family protein [Marinovum sp. 1_MG-2023]